VTCTGRADLATSSLTNPLGDEGDALHGACTHGLRTDSVPRSNAEKRTPLLIVAVIVALAVGAPVILAALLNESKIVKVIDAVRRSSPPQVASSFTGADHGHGVVPPTSAATTTGATTATATEGSGASHRRF
jgi:hypothetical protein